MRLALPVSIVVSFLALLYACSGGLPEGVNGSQTSSVPGASSAPPLPAFTATTSEGIAPLTVTFAQTDPSGTSSWKWDFGDGTTCTNDAGGIACSPEAFAPTHTYTTSGVFSVSLTARGPGGTRVFRIEDAVEVLPTPPVASFAASTTGGVLPLTVNFTNQSTNASSFVWTFGDGGTSTEVSPTHVYTQFGTFDAVLRAAGPGGDSEATTAIFVQAPPPNSNFIAQVGGVTVPVASGPLPFSVQFIQPNAAYTTSRLWQFGDGAFSTLQSPTRTYSTPGLFTVSLTAAGPGGQNSTIQPDLVEAFDELADGSFEGQASGQAPSGPWTSFSGHLGGANAHRVLPSPSPATDLGMPTNGVRWCAVSSASSANTTPPSNPGGITNPAVGAAGIRQQFSFRNGQSRLKFDALFVTGETPGSTTFRDWASVDVSNGSTTRNLFFRDTLSTLTASDSASIPGVQASTALASVSVDLATLFSGSTVGTLFTISAQAGNVGGAARDSYLFLDNVRLEILANPVVANFSAAPLNANLNQNVVFTDSSTGSPVTWAWDFGDGGTSASQNPVRPYTTTGPKTVRLTASKPGSSDTLIRTNYVNVFGAPSANFTASPLSGRAPLLVSIDNTSTNVSGVTYSWNFDDGTTSTLAEPGNHSFRNSGTSAVTRTITLTASTPTSPVQTAVRQIQVVVQPESRFSTDIYPILSGDSCVGCHSTFGSNGNFEFDIGASFVRNALVGNTPQCTNWNSTHDPDRYVIAGDIANSFLWRRVGVNTNPDSAAGCLNRVMPTSGSLDPDTIDKFRSWIEAGANAN